MKYISPLFRARTPSLNISPPPRTGEVPQITMLHTKKKKQREGRGDLPRRIRSIAPFTAPVPLYQYLLTLLEEGMRRREGVLR